MRILSIVTLALATLILHCGDDGAPCPAGSLDCPCDEGGSCFDGLTCSAASLCETAAVDDGGTRDMFTMGDAGDDASTLADAGTCVDDDLDGRGEGCAMGPDCDDSDPWNWASCGTCNDADGDDWWVDCDRYDDALTGPDCDDTNINVFFETGCAECVDEDNDGYFTGCDLYGADRPGPDCDDENENVGVVVVEEICDGLSSQCNGEVDRALPADMCPAEGDPTPPNLLRWGCAGLDGCVIKRCAPGFHDRDGELANGCECEGTIAECS